MEDIATYYNRIRDFSQQKHAVEPSILKEVGHIFVRYGAQHTFALTLLHRHRTLDPGCIMVHNGDAAEEDICVMELIGKRELYPSSFFMSREGRFMPLEFSTRRASIPAEDFLADLGSFLHTRGLKDVFGIAHIGRSKVSWIERQLSTNRGTIATAVKTLDCSVDGVITAWSFSYYDSVLIVQPIRKCETAQSGGHKVT